MGEFYFDGISSANFDLYSINKDGQFKQTTLIGNANIHEKNVNYDYKPIFQKVKRNPLEKPLRLMRMNKNSIPLNWTPGIMQDVVKWLIHKEYKPLYFVDNPDRIYYVMCNSNINLSNAVNLGYLDLTFRVNSPYAYRESRIVEIDATNIPKTMDISCDYYLAENVFPVINIKKTGTTNGVLNLFIQGEENEHISFTGLPSNVGDIKIFTKQGIIKDMVTGEYLYHYRNKLRGDKWIELVSGENKVSLSEGWKATFEFQEAIF